MDSKSNALTDKKGWRNQVKNRFKPNIDFMTPIVSKKKGVLVLVFLWDSLIQQRHVPKLQMPYTPKFSSKTGKIPKSVPTDPFRTTLRAADFNISPAQKNMEHHLCPILETQGYFSGKLRDIITS